MEMHLSFLLALLMCLLLLPPAALAYEEASTPLEVTLSYEPVQVLADVTLRRTYLNSDWGAVDENGYVNETIMEFEEDADLKLGLPQGWTACWGQTDGAFAAWQSPDGGVHAEFCYLSLPFDRQWYSSFFIGGNISYSTHLRYRNAYCDVDLLPRLTSIDVDDPWAQVDAYHINHSPVIMYLAADQRTLVLYEYDFGLCLVLWADEGAVLPSETLLTEIASTFGAGPAGYFGAAE